MSFRTKQYNASFILRTMMEWEIIALFDYLTFIRIVLKNYEK